MQYTVLIPGGFKPPHKGHYDYIKFYLDNPDVTEVRLYIGQKERDEISLETTEEMLRLYGLLDHPKMTFQRAAVREGKKGLYTNPLLDCYEYAETRVEEPMGLACSSKDKNYQERFNAYFKDIRFNIVEVPMFEMKDELSATDFRAALRNGESIIDFLPDGVSEEQIMQLFKA
jgi:nicotinamide mononucleotide adenylyltransferase